MKKKKKINLSPLARVGQPDIGLQADISGLILESLSQFLHQQRLIRTQESGPE